MRTWSFSKREGLIWLIFIGLNILLFIPWYLFSGPGTQFFPIKGFFEGTLFERFKFLFSRNNHDAFRLSFDLIVLFMAIYFTRNKPYGKRVVTASFVYYLLILMYHWYAAFFISLYKVPAVFFNDYLFFVNGLKIIADEFDFFSFLVLLLSLLLFYGLFRIFRYTQPLLTTINLNRISMVLIGLILLYAVTGQIRYGTKNTPDLTVRNAAVSVGKNIYQSVETYNFIKNFDKKAFDKYSDQYQFKLDKKRPNLIIIFVESYGRIMEEDPILKKGYVQLISEKETLLRANNYSMASSFSEAPISGGGSWLSYTTFTLGFKLELQSLYFNMLSNKVLDDYLHLFRWLNDQGYKNYRLNSLYNQGNFSIPWDRYTTFFNVDEWIKYEDLEYDGVLYGFGPSPPDQYSVNFTLDKIDNEHDGPYSLFFISKNSHNPFKMPHEIKDDWRDWDKIKGENAPSRFFYKPTLDNYQKAIAFQLDYIVDLISKRKGDDIYIVIGDHQPPALKSDSFDTPIHIISKDQELINGFKAYGFTNGLLPGESPIGLKHEALYSMLIRELKRNYSSDSLTLPAFLPDGITFGH